MSQSTEIGWTDATWPVIRGCSKVSDGCKNCWAIRDAHLHAGNKNPKMQAHFQGLTVIENGRPNWTGAVRLDESILNWPIRWRKHRRIFAASSGDLFHENLPDESIDRVFATMEVCRHHTFQILTKRPERMREYLSQHWQGWRRAGSLLKEHGFRPLDNVWLGVSVEDQQTADQRIPELLRTPAAVRFISYEPALGPLDASQWLPSSSYSSGNRTAHGRQGIDWVIAGGESGPGARPAHPDWFRSIQRQCQAAGVPFFFKQWGAWIQEGETTRKVSKKKAGCLLDGCEWKQFPTVWKQFPTVR